MVVQKPNPIKNGGWTSYHHFNFEVLLNWITMCLLLDTRDGERNTSYTHGMLSLPCPLALGGFRPLCLQWKENLKTQRIRYLPNIYASALGPKMIWTKDFFSNQDHHLPVEKKWRNGNGNDGCYLHPCPWGAHQALGFLLQCCFVYF